MDSVVEIATENLEAQQVERRFNERRAAVQTLRASHQNILTVIFNHYSNMSLRENSWQGQIKSALQKLLPEGTINENTVLADLPSISFLHDDDPLLQACIEKVANLVERDRGMVANYGFPYFFDEVAIAMNLTNTPLPFVFEAIGKFMREANQAIGRHTPSAINEMTEQYKEFERTIVRDVLKAVEKFYREKDFSDKYKCPENYYEILETVMKDRGHSPEIAHDVVDGYLYIALWRNFTDEFKKIVIIEERVHDIVSPPHAAEEQITLAHS